VHGWLRKETAKLCRCAENYLGIGAVAMAGFFEFGLKSNQAQSCSGYSALADLPVQQMIIRGGHKCVALIFLELL
jgi:hypothetical protein